MTKRTIYLDNAATTPVRQEVLEAMLPFLTEQAFGNPSSAHHVGRNARIAVDRARRAIAEALGVSPGQVVFTSGGTEADNLAVIGGALAARDAGQPFRVAVSAIEHKAVLAAAKAVARLGGEAVFLPVDSCGRVLRSAVESELARGLGVVSTMWVNNELGTVEDVAALGALCRGAGVTFHTDAVQALGKIPVNVNDIPCVLMTISGHKIGAPKGIGALIVKDRSAVEAIIHGGGQQLGIRPGTENVPGIVALGRAVQLAVAEQDSHAAATRRLRDDFESRLVAGIPDAVINGGNGERAPHISNVSIPGTDSEAMLMHLDLAGICCSSGSACSTGSVEPSHVLTAIGSPPDLAVTALRFSFSTHNTPADVDAVMDELPRVTERIRKLAGMLGRQQ